MARREPYQQIVEGEWIEPVMRGFIHQCCDCALVHVTDYAVERGRVQFKLRVDRRLTAASRRKFTCTCTKKDKTMPRKAKAAPSRVIDTDSATRKTFPMAAGLLDYFPDALAEVSRVSFLGNEKHNPGEVMHHARGKSMDHADCIMRHLVGRGGFDGDVRESAALAWRALALLQEELEGELALPLPRGAKAAPVKKKRAA